LSQFGALGKYEVQLDTSALQLRMLRSLKGDDIDVAALPGLMTDLVGNARKVLSGNDQVGPVAMVLGQIVREARLAGVDIPPEALDVLGELANRCDASLKPLLEAALKEQPSAVDVTALLRTVESARHAEDFAFDLRHIIVVARRLLSGDEALAGPAVASFAVELLSDRAIVPPGAEGPVLPHEVDRALAQATAMAAATSLPVRLRCGSKDAQSVGKDRQSGYHPAVQCHRFLQKDHEGSFSRRVYFRQSRRREVEAFRAN
jgi:hypothetical protein